MENILIDALKKAQELQVKVLMLNDGHDLHIDAFSTEKRMDVGYHPSFSVTLFDHLELTDNWDFDAWDSESLIAARLTEMEVIINSL